MNHPEPRVLSWRYGRHGLGVVLGAIAVLVLSLVSPGASHALGPGLPGLDLQRAGSLVESGLANRAIATRQINLDGYDLFAIAAPALEQDSQSSETSPIQERGRGIEASLERIASRDFDPQTLDVTAEIDARSNLPVISVNGQYLMTVTTLDAQLQVQEPERWAAQLTQIIEQALRRAYRERQPEFLTRQSWIASGILLGMVGGSGGLARVQQRLKRRQKRLEAMGQPQPLPSATKPRDFEAIATPVKPQRPQPYVRNLNDIWLRLLQLVQGGIWVGGFFGLLGLFPYTRWLQPLLFSAPLKILLTGLGIYVLMRISDILIERFATAFARGRLIEPESPQRLNLRVSTVSRVFKSGASVIWIAVGFLTVLSIVGVDLIPLLAGAGIIGLAISFAAQSLIKDMINGLLILFEDHYGVGDVIIVGDAAGLVENMNLRITQLRDSEGQLITIPNSAVTVVRNLSKDWSRVDLAIDLAYGTNPDHALDVIRQLAQEFYQDPEWQAKMPDQPEVLGIDQVDHSGLLVRVWIKTLPLQQWPVAREFRRRLALRLEQEGLAIAVPQQSLWFKTSLDLDLDPLNGRISQPSPR